MNDVRPNSFHKFGVRFGNNIKYAIQGYFTEYETPKLVLIHSVRFGVLLRIMQIIILVYSVLYLLIYEKGYQKHDTAIISSITLKVKGIGYVRARESLPIVVDVAGKKNVFCSILVCQFDYSRLYYSTDGK
jgi:hypothetical protein